MSHLAYVRFVTLAIHLALSGAVIGCNRLPETIRYDANIRENSKYEGGSDESGSHDYRVAELVGAELKLDGTKVAELNNLKGKVSLHGEWSGPKAGLRAQLNGKYTVTTKGICGPYDLPLDGPPANWKAMDDAGIAKAMNNYGGKLAIFLDALLPARQEIYVDWGDAQGTLTIGTATIEQGKKTTKLSFGGCKAPLPVMFNGKSIGDIDFDAKATLITLEPNICHVLQQVGYGNQSATRSSTFFEAKSILSLAEYPNYVLKSGPASFKLSGKGTTITELLRTRCR